MARASTRVTQTQADWPNLPAYPSLTAMLAAGVDAVTITTPPQTRRELVLEAIEAGVPVVAGKPFAPSTKASRQLPAATKAKGVYPASVLVILMLKLRRKRLGLYRHSNLDCE